VSLDVEDADLARQDAVRKNQIFEELPFREWRRWLRGGRLGLASRASATGGRFSGATSSQESTEKNRHQTPNQHRACHISLLRI
jgi:hypothetical protein